MTKTLKTTIICSAIFCGLFAVIILLLASNMLVYGKDPTIDDDFVAWSNTTHEEEATIQLKDFLSAFDNVEDATAWLESKGFRVEKPRLLGEGESRALAIEEEAVFSLVATWNVEEKGVIFAPGLFSKFESKLFVYLISIGITYSDGFVIHRVRISRARL